MREGKAKERTLKRVVFTNLEEGICNSMVLKKKKGGGMIFFFMVEEHIKSSVFDECIIAISKVNQVEISNRPLEEQDKFGEETLTADVNL